MGSFGKIVFHKFVESECERRMFWLLGAEEPDWMVQPRKPLHGEGSQSQENVGKEYERKVYNILRAMRSVVCRVAPSREVSPQELRPEFLRELAQDLRAGDFRLLLEHHWTMEPSFVQEVFGLGAGEVVPIRDVDDKSLRPDLIVVERLGADETDVVVRADGSWGVERVGGRLKLSVIDIKHTSEQSVGRKHFAELLVYGHSLAHWLRARGLDDVCYASARDHGILPYVDLSGSKLRTSTLEELREVVVSMEWDDVHVLYEQTCARLRLLAKRRPLRVEDVPLRLSPICGYCKYLEDCKKTLRNGHDQEPGKWDVRLLPYTSATVGDLLHRRGYKTIEDVARRLEEEELGEVPGPLYAERPQLILKARALMQGVVLPADEGSSGGQRLFSMAAPRSLPMRLFFDVETDTTLERVFALGLSLEVSTSRSFDYAEHLDRWWGAWEQVLKSNASEAQMLATIRAAINPELLNYLRVGAPRLPIAEEAREESDEVDAQVEGVDEIIRNVWRGLKTLDVRDQLNFKEGNERFVRDLKAMVTYVNPSQEHEDEEELCRVLVKNLFAIVAVCHGTEQLVGHVRELDRPDKDGNTVFVLSAPAFGVLYWSSEQVEQISDLMERHLSALHQERDYQRQIDVLIQWFAPSSSGIVTDQQAKKIFDIRKLIESTAGYPHVINTTWQRLFKDVRRDGWDYSTRYWGDHFNYMDAQVWRELLATRNTDDRRERAEKIAGQLKWKLWGISRLFGEHLAKRREQLGAQGSGPPQRRRLDQRTVSSAPKRTGMIAVGRTVPVGPLRMRVNC
jgi:hypothetical protein